MATKLLKWGNGLGLLIPAFAAKSFGLKAGSFVRVIVLERELRIRPVGVPCVDDFEPLGEESAGQEMGGDGEW